MAPNEDTRTNSASLLGRRTSRRALLAGGAAAASVAGAYAVLGDPLHLLTSAHHGTNAGAATAVRSDTGAISKESVRISHLLRRTGFGVTREEFDHYQSLGLKATTDELVNYKTVDDSATDQLADKVNEAAGARRVAPVAWWLTRMANTRRPLQEKMTLFWHSLLTSQLSVVRDPQAMVNQNQFYRDHAMDAFPAILKGVTKDPAMMAYLNIEGSLAKAPNENYARELMELFSLGIGNYTEEDVRQAARAFTGWAIPRTRTAQGLPQLGSPVFRPGQFDNGTKTFLGKTGDFKPDDIIDLITAQPASQKYIVRRLFGSFIYPDPSDADIAPFVDVYNQNAMSVGSVVEAMLRSDVFYSPKAYRAIVKSPAEFAVSALKAVNGQAAAAQLAQADGGAQRLGGVTAAMGQTLFEPPNVAGWPGNGTWLNSATLFARLNYVNSVTGGGANARNQRGVAAGTADLNLGDTASALSYFLPLALDDNIPDEARQTLTDYAGGASATLAPEQLRGLAYLVLGSPQFHLS